MAWCQYFLELILITTADGIRCNPSERRSSTHSRRIGIIEGVVGPGTYPVTSHTLVQKRKYLLLTELLVCPSLRTPHEVVLTPYRVVRPFFHLANLIVLCLVWGSVHMCYRGYGGSHYNLSPLLCMGQCPNDHLV